MDEREAGSGDPGTPPDSAPATVGAATGARKALGWVGVTFDWSLRAVVCALYIAILVVVNLGVFYRYVLDDPLIWSDTIATWCFIWMSLLAAALAVPLRAHMVADLLPAALPSRFRVYFRVLYYGSFVVAGYLLLRSGLELVDVTGDRKGTAVDIPLRVPMLAIPVAAVLLLLQGARCLFRVRAEMRAGDDDVATEIAL